MVNGILLSSKSLLVAPPTSLPVNWPKKYVKVIDSWLPVFLNTNKWRPAHIHLADLKELKFVTGKLLIVMSNLLKTPSMPPNFKSIPGQTAADSTCNTDQWCSLLFLLGRQVRISVKNRTNAFFRIRTRKSMGVLWRRQWTCAQRLIWHPLISKGNQHYPSAKAFKETELPWDKRPSLHVDK